MEIKPHITQIEKDISKKTTKTEKEKKRINTPKKNGKKCKNTKMSRQHMKKKNTVKATFL